jgi:hypothetical protein
MHRRLVVRLEAPLFPRLMDRRYTTRPVPTAQPMLKADVLTRGQKSRGSADRAVGIPTLRYPNKEGGPPVPGAPILDGASREAPVLGRGRECNR